MEYLVYNNTLWKPYKSFEFTGEPEEFTLQPDTYLFVANGARGGRTVHNPFISWGGTTYGILDLNHTQTMYAVVGGNGEDPHNKTDKSPEVINVRAAGGYNGGGSGGIAYNPASYVNGCGGGGATDVRLSTDESFVPPIATHSIPEGYDQVSYINADLQQYILVDYTLKSNTRMEMLAYSNPDGTSTSSGVASETLFSAMGSANANRFIWQLKRGDVADKNMYFVYGTDHRGLTNWSYYDIMKISLESDNGETHFTDEIMYSNSTGSTAVTPASTKMCIFGQYNESTQQCIYKCKAAVLYAKIFEGNKLARWLVPYCKHATDGESIDLSSITWQNNYYDDTLTTQYMHIQDYIPIDATCEGIRVHLTLDGVDDFIIRVDYYDQDYVQIPGISTDIKISYLPMGNYMGSSRKPAIDVGNDLNIYPPFSNARYVRMAIYHPTTALDASMVDEFSMTYLTYEDGFEAGLYDLIEGKMYPCITSAKMYYGNPVTKTVYKSRYTNTKYIRTIFRRTRSNGYLSLSYLVFKDKDDSTIPVSSVSAITTNGSAVLYTPSTATADNLIVEDSSSWMTVDRWIDNDTDVIITYELENEIRSDYIKSYAIMTSSYSRSSDPYEWEIQISSDNINWTTFDRRLTALPSSDYAVTAFNIYQPDAPFNIGLYSRILVAGGGGGPSNMYNQDTCQDFTSFGGGARSGWVTCNGADTGQNVWLAANQTSGNAFGVGGNAQDRTSGSSTWSFEGQAGGGGGWYGGYAVKDRQSANYSYSACCGSGGSSYVLTADSFKPDNYMRSFEDIMPTLYFRDFMMLPYQAFNGPSLTIYKEAEYASATNDVIRVPYTGTRQSVDLIPGTYRIKCYGGDGGVRMRNNQASKGGYSEGLLRVDDIKRFAAHVGSSAYLAGIGTNAANHDAIFGNRIAYNVRIGSYDQYQRGATMGGGATDVRLLIPPHKIPDEYDQVEYIESNRTQHIDLNHFFNADTSKYEIVTSLNDPASLPSIPRYLILLGQRNESTTNMFMLFYRDNDINQTTFGIGDTYYYGTVMPFNTKIRIVATGKNTIAWYDMNNAQIGSLSIGNWSFTSSLSTYLFGFNNNDTGSGARGAVKVYSLKIYENDVLKRYYIPFKSKPDASEQISGLYDIINGVAYTSPIGDPFVCGDVVEKTEYEDEQESLLTRIIVAGGGGGQGKNDGWGGNGGGTSGNWCINGGYGTNNGPGTQNSTPSQGTAGGGFGRNGVGTFENGGFGGSGGNGWFGGNGTQPDGSSDDDKGGCGGSGYILTESSYKPTGYIPDEKYWMSEAVTTTGGNPVRGMTQILFEIEKASALYVIARDDYSYKAYDIENDEWYPIEIELTPESFEAYGVQIGAIVSDTGLTSSYKLYVYDKFTLGPSALSTHVIPIDQHVLFHENTTAEILDSSYDYDNDENTSVALEYTVKGAAENRRVKCDMTFSMSDVPTKNTTVYCVQFKTRRKPTSHRYPTPIPIPPEPIRTNRLLRVGTGSTVPNRYKTSIGGFMPDGTTAITSVNCSSSCEHKRSIYTVSLLNNSILRFTRYNIIENKCTIIRDNVNPSLLNPDKHVCGSLLVDDNYMYLFNSTSTYDYWGNSRIQCIRVPIDPSGAITSYLSSSDNDNYYSNCFGEAYWLTDNEIIMHSKYGLIVFNTSTLRYTYYADSDRDTGDRNDISVGKYTIISFWYSNDCTGPRRYSTTTRNRVTTGGTSFTYPKGIKCSCYGDGKFYVAFKGHIYILEDNAECDPTFVEDILTPFTSLTPKTITYANGILYVTMVSSTTLYIYNIATREWASMPMPFNNAAINNTNYYRPAAFNTYFFIEHLKLLTVNFATYSKYRIGEKSTTLLIRTNDNHSTVYEPYDERFITIDETGIDFHTGDIVKNLNEIDSTSHIYESETYVKNTDYSKIIGFDMVFNDNEEEEVEDNNG